MSRRSRDVFWAVLFGFASLGLFWTWTLTLDHPDVISGSSGALVVAAIICALVSAISAALASDAGRRG